MPESSATRGLVLQSASCIKGSMIERQLFDCTLQALLPCPYQACLMRKLTIRFLSRGTTHGLWVANSNSPYLKHVEPRVLHLPSANFVLWVDGFPAAVCRPIVCSGTARAQQHGLEPCVQEGRHLRLRLSGLTCSALGQPSHLLWIQF